MAQPSVHQVTPPAPAPTVREALSRATARLAELQEPSGAWRGAYGGPLFLLPTYVAAHAVTGRDIPAERGAEMVRYLKSVLKLDGSVGLHAESQGCMFTTSLCYVALRLLGVVPTDGHVARMRRWIREHGTPLGSASWGKFVLALLGLYEYRGLHPILPELWLLPRSAPIHPGRLWCHCRQVYLPMAYLYGRRVSRPVDSLTEALRGELYDRPYDELDFAAHRDTLFAGDCYARPTWPLTLAQRAMDLFERVHGPGWRNQALGTLLEHIRYEDEVTDFIRIGPVNAALNTVVRWDEDPTSEAVERSFAMLDGYLWEGPDGVEMNGYNSTALWDTAFAVQALLVGGLGDDVAPTLERAHEYLRQSQVLRDVPAAERHFRHACRGGWPFSDRAHGWPITDCTAEGLKCALALRSRVSEPIDAERLGASARLLLSWQNRGGGWSTYERQRGSSWLELLNPSQVFADIMVDYPYVECTSACLQALSAVLADRRQRRAQGRDRHEPWPPAWRIGAAIRRGRSFVLRAQRPDGSWEGSWGVCFTYGTWFAVAGLLASGCSPGHPAIVRGCDFLKAHQRPDGGWGEDGTSSAERRYVESRESHPVQTAWALSTLVRAGQSQGPAAGLAARWLVEHQLPSGDWPRQTMVGVFNKTALIHYDNYRRYFPLWALGEYARARTSAR